MELVYLWVEEYKNIKNQGFNFSPRFDCSYDKDTEELTIDENKDYINIFPENINVTAIVGENGSGKSSLSEILGIFTWTEDLENNSFLVFFDEKNFLFKKRNTGDNLEFKVKNQTQFTFNNQYISRMVFAIYFSNEISTFLNKETLIGLNKYDGFDAYTDDSQYLMTNNKLQFDDSIKSKYEIFSKRFYTLLKENPHTFDYINENFIFNKFKHELHLYELGTWIIDNKEILELFPGKELIENTIFQEVDASSNNKISFYKIIILLRISLIGKKEFIPNMVKDITDNFNKSDFTENDYIEINKIITKYSSNNEEIYSIENINKILDNYTYVKDEIWIENESNDIKKEFVNNNLLLLLLIENFNRTNFFNHSENIDFFSLSSGEREYLNIITGYIFNLKKYRSNEKFVYIFDEPDLGLHPNWQKKLIKDLVYYGKVYCNFNLKILITSHSPFILSDLPKENVIFIKKDENGNCKNISKDIDINPFGANIHTLLSHGFFMEDGLMGEFAKEKINDVIKYLNGEKSIIQSIKEAQNIINIIGEPVLKSTLQNMLNEKKYPNDSKLKKLKKEKERLEKEIKELEGKSDE